MPVFESNTIQVHIVAYDSSCAEYKVLLLQRSAEEPIYPSIWQVITGTIEQGETALATAIREVGEETSLNILKMWTVPYITSFFNPHKDAVCFSPVFAVLADMQQKIVLSAEHQAFKWVSIATAIDSLPLPSHSEGCRVLNDYILNSVDIDLYKVTL